MANRLSHSQIRLYTECGKKYEYYYKQRLRERTKSSALFFGTAIDKAVEAVVKDPTVDEYAVFDAAWATQDINGALVSLVDSLSVNYSKADFDDELLTEQDLVLLVAKIQELLPALYEESQQEVREVVARCQSFKSQQPHRVFRKAENIILNLASWLSLRRKGHVMLKTHREQILPRIKKVHGTQLEISLVNDSGDSVLGYADGLFDWDEEGNKILFDYKTSSIKYDDDSVSVSPQLALYCHALGLKKAGFIVFNKAIQKNRKKICSVCENDGTGARHQTCAAEVAGKRCGGKWVETLHPSATVQVIIDEIPESTENMVLENIEAVNKGIKAEVFTRNFGACDAFGGCVYRNMCYKGDCSGLDKVEEKV